MSRNTRFGLGFAAFCVLGFIGLYNFFLEVADGITLLTVAYAMLWLGALAGLNLLVQRWRAKPENHRLEEEH